MPIGGFTRQRKHLVGKQTSYGSNTAATRQLPYRGPIVVQPTRTLPDVDMGSFDPILPSFNGPKEVSANWTGKADYDSLPLLWGMFLKGGVTPTGGGAAKTWTFQASSLTADDFDYVTDEFGDDQTTDVVVAGGGVIDSLELSFGEDLSAWDVNAQVIYARAHYNATGFTGGITPDTTPAWLYGGDTEVYLDTVYSSIGTTKLTDAVHAAGFSGNNNLDRKRFANGSNTRFQLAGVGRGERVGEIKLTLAKTTATIAMAQRLDDEPVVTEFLELRTTSPEIITGATPFSQSIRVPVELIDRADGEMGGNSTIELTYRVKYDANLGYAYRVVVVCAATA